MVRLSLRSLPSILICGIIVGLIYLLATYNPYGKSRMKSSPSDSFIELQAVKEASPSADSGSTNSGHSSVVFTPGTIKSAGQNYTRHLVIPRTKSEDVNWVHENFARSDTFTPKIYVVDDMTAPLHPPENKGHEVMVYLSYIIDHYDDALPDIAIFMHAHRYSWHNDALLNNDAVEIISRLSAERVQRQGYMNLRCAWNPGCPAWMHPGTTVEDVNKQEEFLLRRVWTDLFPFDATPEVLAQPCCGQFAISRDRIRTLPKSQFVYWRDWLLRTQLSDYVSGRIWEYIWQYVFSGQTQLCPEEHVCHCDGYGICFGGKAEYELYVERAFDRKHFAEELEKWNAQKETFNADSTHAEAPVLDKNIELKHIIGEIDYWLAGEKRLALERGEIAENRAKERGEET